MAVLLIGSALVWRPGENPILLYLFGYQWLQASALIFLGNAQGETLNQLSQVGGDTGLAATLSLVGLVVFAMALSVGAGRRAPQMAWWSRQKAWERPVSQWFWLYAAAAVIAAIATAGAWLVPGLSQPILAFAALKWAFFFALAYVVFVRGEPVNPFFAAAFLIELAASVGGYFSDFKTVFIVTIIAAITAGVKLSPRAFVALGAFVATLGVLGVIWTAVKVDYRNFASGGETAQVVTVGYSERLAYLGKLVRDLDRTQYVEGAETLVRRIAYVEFFGATLDQVPAFVPHERGKLFIDAISRPFMPRLFFPNKPVIDDSERTNRYTGLSVAGADRGTSISLGWMAESYIDFGRYGMFAGIFAVGLAYGRIYRLISFNRATGPLLGGALAMAVLRPAAALESSLTKVAGGVAVSLLVALLLIRVVLPQLCAWALNTPAQRQPAPL